MADFYTMDLYAKDKSENQKQNLRHLKFLI